MNEDKYVEMLEDGILYDYIIDLQKQLEAYENTRKEAIEYIEDNSAFLENDEYEVFNKRDLLNILNKVGKDNETV